MKRLSTVLICIILDIYIFLLLLVSLPMCLYKGPKFRKKIDRGVKDWVKGLKQYLGYPL